MAGSSAEEENYWPGYVDALTTMTMVLTFIMMILGIVIFSMSQNVSKAIIEAVAEAAKVDIASSGGVEQLKNQLIEALERARQEPSSPSPPVPEQSAPPSAGTQKTPPTSTFAEEKRIESDGAPETKPPPRGATVARAGAVLTIGFRKKGIELDDRSKAELKAVLDSADTVRTAAAIEVKAYADRRAVAVTEARRLAYYRAMLMRKSLVEAGIPSDRITVRLEDGTKSDADLVRIFTR